MEMNAPITLELQVWAINTETKGAAIITMSMPRGRFPTPDSIKGLLAHAEANLPEGYALMNKSQFFNALLADEYGAAENFATPGSPDFIDGVIVDDEEADA